MYHTPILVFINAVLKLYGFILVNVLIWFYFYTSIPIELILESNIIKFVIPDQKKKKKKSLYFHLYSFPPVSLSLAPISTSPPLIKVKPNTRLPTRIPNKPK